MKTTTRKASTTTAPASPARAAHTPGPWVASFNGSDDCRIFAESVADTPRAVCKVNAPLGRHLEASANAALIAAAPDLLAAAQSLEAIVSAFVQDELSLTTIEEAADLLPRLRAAIARATAEGVKA